MRILIIFLFFTSSVLGQEVNSLAYSNIKSVVEFLASDSLKGRATGSPEEKISADYIATKLRETGYKIRMQKFSFIYENLKYKSQNVIGFINKKKDSTLLITAHYDHLGMGEYKSLSRSRKTHNGADDNASGVALLLELANDLADSIQNYNLLFVSYSGHELGLYGSQFFSNHLSPKYKKIALALNFDMVGRMDQNSNCYYEENLIKIDDLVLNTKNVNWTRSVKERLTNLDSKWFFEKGIPSMTISTGIHIDYHRYTDKVQYINWKGLKKIHTDLRQWLLKKYK